MPRQPLIGYPPAWLGQVDVSSGVLQVGGLEIFDVGSGYPQANVYVERVSGKGDGVVVGTIIIEIIGDGTAQRALDAENAEAELYPGGPKEYWRSKGMSEEELADWDDGDYPESPRCPWRG